MLGPRSAGTSARAREVMGLHLSDQAFIRREKLRKGQLQGCEWSVDFSAILYLESRVSRATLRGINDSYSVYMYTKARVTGTAAERVQQR